jgi:hypothetical protein
MNETEFPEGVYDSFRLEFKLDRETGNYSIYCQEWRCELAGGQWPGESALRLVNEIAAHNRSELAQPLH